MTPVDHVSQVPDLGCHLLRNAEGEIENLGYLGQLVRRSEINRDAGVELEDIARQILTPTPR